MYKSEKKQHTVDPSKEKRGTQGKETKGKKGKRRKLHLKDNHYLKARQSA